MSQPDIAAFFAQIGPFLHGRRRTPRRPGPCMASRLMP